MGRYRMKAVSRLTGVRPELLRMWEKRYPLFKPQRAGNRYREFDDEDVQLLLYIRQQIEQGRSIGELAAEGREALLRRMAPPTAQLSPEQQAYACLIDELLDAIRHLERARLETRLAECAVHYSFATLLHMVFVPLMHRLGELWVAKEVSVASEHFATMLLKQRLLTMLQAAAPGGNPPLLLCACPAGEFHELGLLTFAYTLQQDGWQVCYLGPDLPVPDLLYSCQRLQPALVALSLTHAAESTGCLDVLHDIDAAISRTYPTFVGGQGIEAQQPVVHPRHALCFPTLQAAQTHARHLYARLITPQTAPAPGKVAVHQ
jgi:DNA-binding transcriptional MerR regulator